MTASAKSVLSEIEQELVDRSKKLEGHSHADLTALASQLRSHRERTLRRIREGNRIARKSGDKNTDAAAFTKKDTLVEAIDRVGEALAAHAQAFLTGQPIVTAPSKAKGKVNPVPPKTAKSKPAAAKPTAKTAEPKPAAKAGDKKAPSKADKDKPAKK